MRTAISTAITLIALALPVSAGAEVVTGSPAVQRDLIVSVAYWHTPAPCGAIVVEVTALAPAEGANGTLIPNPWAETVDGSCLVKLSPELWTYEAANESIVCEVMVHEYGHVLGLPDSPEIGEMNQYPEERAPIAACTERTETVASTISKHEEAEELKEATHRHHKHRRHHR